MPTKAPLGQHLLDSGPLLCLGGSAVLRDLYDQLHAADAAVVGAVRDEIKRLAEVRAPHRTGRNEAAARAGKRYHPLLTEAIDITAPTPQDVTDLETEMHRREEASAVRKGRPYRFIATKHRGEAESVHIAALSGRAFVTNDIDASTVAEGRGVVVDSFVDVARRMMRAQTTVRARKIASELQLVKKLGIDIGGTVNSQLDLTRPQRRDR